MIFLKKFKNQVINYVGVQKTNSINYDWSL